MKCGALPLDMPMEQFVSEAEQRLRQLPKEVHFRCYIFKKKLLEVIPGKCEEYPEFRLLYARTIVETALHEFVAGDPRMPLVRAISEKLRQVKALKMWKKEERRKEMLVGLLEGLLARLERRTEVAIVDTQVPHRRLRVPASLREKQKLGQW